MRHSKLVFSALAALCAVLVPNRASADIDLARALLELGFSNTTGVLAGRLEALVQGEAPGGTLIAPGWSRVSGTPDELLTLATLNPGLPLWWSPPRRLLLDRVDGWVRASTVRNSTGLTGKGVVVGIVDSGLDLMHPDFRTPDGKTRVRWLIDYSRPAAGRQPDLEKKYGCTGDTDCAVFSNEDLDELLSNDVDDDEPRDGFGHGTHVTSLAAGNGIANSPAKYVGIAPDADLVIARVAKNGGGGISDADVVSAAAFVFERAEAMGEPAVVNLSLGSDFGAHDGSSALERGLSSLVGEEFPGRAIVVAAGNSAGLLAADDVGLPQPMGIHTEVHVPRESTSIVPIVAPLTGQDLTKGSIYIWIASQASDDIRVGVDTDEGPLIEPMRQGDAGVLRDHDASVTIVNQIPIGDFEVSPVASSAAVLIEGSWPSKRHYKLRFEGYGTAEIWLQSDGDLAPGLSVGALVPRAFKEGTINMPASAPDLISVGATLNRTDWSDYLGENVSMPQHGALDEAPDDTTAYFSSAGPTALGVMKPDLVAPGANVAGAMARAADPRPNGGSLFGGGGRCAPDYTEECFVVDDFHAVTSGTSMAAPVVAGAVALLLERQPTLDQFQIRALLQAGARRLEGVTFSEQQVGPGALDLEGALLAAIEESNPADRLPTDRSWLSLAAPFAPPDSAMAVPGVLELRDDEDRPADGFDPKRLTLVVSGGGLSMPLTRIAPGLWSFSVSAPSGRGEESLELEVRFDGQSLISKRLPIAVDHGVYQDGVAARGGCSFSTQPSAAWWASLFVLGLATGGTLRRKRRTSLQSLAK